MSLLVLCPDRNEISSFLRNICGGSNADADVLEIDHVKVAGFPSLLERKDNVSGMYSYAYRIDNKYYSAKISIHFIDASVVAPPSLPDSVVTSTRGIVIIHPVQAEGHYYKNWMDTVSVINPEMRIFMVSTPKDSYDLTRFRSEHIDWCLDHQFEFNRVAYDQHEEAERSDDLTGFHRVIEAAECVSWPDLRMKNDSSDEDDAETDANHLEEAAAAAAAAESPSPSAESPSPNEQEGTGARPPLVCRRCGAKDPTGTAFKRCSRCKKAYYCSKECQTAHWHHHRGECRPNVPPPEPVLPFPEMPREMKSEEEINFDNLEKAIQFGKLVREKGGEMSDEERRKAASRAILELMRATGCEEDSEDFLEETGTKE